MPTLAPYDALPTALLEFLIQAFGSRRHLAAVEITQDRKIVRWHGEPEYFSLNLAVGDNISEVLPVMLGFESESRLELSNLAIADNRPFDLHVFPTDQQGNLMVVLLSAGETIEHEQEIQQKANEISILNYRQEQLMKALEKARAQEKQASQLKSQFIASMSHEFRTPLTAILGLCEILQRHPDQALQRVDAISRSANHLLALVWNLLEHGRVEANEIRIDPLAVNLESTILGLQPMFDPLAQQKGLNLRFAPEGELPTAVITDPVRLRQILVNLVGNALRYTSEGEVRVQWLHQDDQLTIKVSDTGPGIPEEEQRTIFQPFAQLDGDRGKGGIGLGLSICQRMAEALYGELMLDSTPGQGSTFTLVVPCVDAGSSATAVTVSDDALVLVVDDDEDIRELLLVVLQDMSFQVMAAATASQALEMAASLKPPLVLADINLSEDDGLELIQTLSQQYPEMRIIAMSANTDEHSQRAARGAGATTFLVKPFDFAELEYELRNQQFARDGKQIKTQDPIGDNH
jgi:signal transduction histidine kinase